MNRKFNLTDLIYVLLFVYVVWFLFKPLTTIQDALLGLGLIGYCVYQQYLEKLKLMEGIRSDYEKLNLETKKELEYVRTRLHELDEVKKLLVATKSIGSISQQTNQFKF